MAADIYLSPRKILEHLCLLEEKIPRKSNEPYVPTGKILVGESALDKEAAKMFAYVGLGQYIPKCKFAELQDGIAGCIEMGRSGCFANISIDKRYQGNTTVILAILAHEICHKLIYFYGIDFPMMQTANEVYTDLCTLYIGFGDLVIRGYKTVSCNSEGTTTSHMLGYLKYDMYIDTYEIIRCVYGGYKPIDGYSGKLDFFLNRTLEKFVNTQINKSFIIEKLKEKECDLALLHRNILMLEESLKLCYTGSQATISNYNNIAISSGLFSNDLDQDQNKIKVLKCIYDLEHYEEDIVNPYCIIDVRFLLNQIESTLISIWNHYSLKENDINLKIIKCPNCGFVSNITTKHNSTCLIRCHKCHIMFVNDSSPIDGLKWNEKLNILFDNKMAINRQVEQEVKQMVNELPIILRWLVKRHLSRKKKNL